MWQTIPFRTPKVVFGMDSARQTGAEAKGLGAQKALLVTGPSVKSSGALDAIEKSLQEAGIAFEAHILTRTTSEPTTDMAEETGRIIQEKKADLVIGVGGGSVLDVAKMAAAMTANPGKVREYFGPGKVKNKGTKAVLIPTTAGTGSEVTQHAIFLDLENNVKKAVASQAIMADVAIIDPMLTVSSPRSVTAASGFDAWLHAAEPFISKNANPITDALALEAVQRITRNLGTAWSDPKDLDARYNMSLGCLTSGFVLANAGTSLVHAMAYPIGGEFHTPHGISLSVLLLACFKAVVASKGERLKQLAVAMGENVEGLSVREASEVALEAMYNLLRSVKLPVCLSEIGITDRSKVKGWAQDAWNERRLLARAPVELTVEEIADIYTDAFDPYL
ncbi:alcohol dehydrogenase [Synergistales bacterium]|nr:alcohol dehydrogenase [Synergistales bacterium]